MQNLLLNRCIGLVLLLGASLLGCRRIPEKEIPPPRLAERNETLEAVQQNLKQLENSDPATAVNLTDHGDFRVRRAAALRLAELQQETPEALAALSSLLQDEHRRVRSAAMIALLELNAADTIPGMIPLLVDQEGAVRLRAQKTLKSFGEVGIEALIQTLQDPEKLEEQYYEDLRKKKITLSTRVLAALTAAGTAAVDPLIQALKDEDPNIRTTAPMVLASIGVPAQSAVDPLLEILDGDDEQMRAVCARALGAFGQRNERVYNRLKELAADPNKDVARGAQASLTALSRMESDAERQRKHLQRKRDQARKRRENARKIYDGRKIKSR